MPVGVNGWHPRPQWHGEPPSHRPAPARRRPRPPPRGAAARGPPGPLGHPRHRQDRDRLRREPGPAPRVRDRRRRRPPARVRRGVRRPARHPRHRPRRTATTARSWRTPTWTWSTSPPRTPCTRSTSSWPSRPASRCWCEKAITLNAADAADLVAQARAADLFLMEAMWMRCNPLIRRLQQLVASGAVGRGPAGPRRPRLPGRQAVDRPAARPGARRRRAARHGRLPADLRAPVPR